MPFTAPDRRRFLALSGAVALGACTPALTEEEVRAATDLERFGFTPAEGYGLIEDGEYTIPPVPLGYLEYPNRRELVVYDGTESAGTIEIDPHAKFLYWILDDGTAWRYPIAVGRAGRSLRRPTVIRRKVEWPGWTPTANMLRTQPEVYGPFRSGVPGGLASPLGARALYLYQGGRDTYYRIHGTNDLALNCPRRLCRRKRFTARSRTRRRRTPTPAQKPTHNRIFAGESRAKHDFGSTAPV